MPAFRLSEDDESSKSPDQASRRISGLSVLGVTPLTERSATAARSSCRRRRWLSGYLSFEIGECVHEGVHRMYCSLERSSAGEPLDAALEAFRYAYTALPLTQTALKPIVRGDVPSRSADRQVRQDLLFLGLSRLREAGAVVEACLLPAFTDGLGAAHKDAR
jgi:hypothetical protein